MAPTRERRSAHDPGVVLRDLAVAIADGGDSVMTWECCAARRRCSGRSPPETTAHRVIKAIDAERLEAVRAARAKALRAAWDAGARPEELILDIDATLLGAHSEKEGAAGTYKGGFGFFPLLCYLDETGEPLAGSFAPATPAPTPPPITSRSCSWPSSSCPSRDLEREILVRADIGGAPTPSPPTAAMPASASRSAMRSRTRVREAILAAARVGMAQRDRRRRRASARAPRSTELTDTLDLQSWPEGTRLIVRRERPTPAPSSRSSTPDGYRHTAFITDQEDADIAALELRHRRRARVEDAIRVAKHTGMRNMPFAAFAHNQAWLELSLLAAGAALAGQRCLCLEGELALAEPKRVRQRLLHVAGRLVRSGRRVISAAAPRPGPGPRRWRRPSQELRALPVASGP